MTACGETITQWAPDAGTSIWSGTLGGQSLTLLLSTQSGAPAGAVALVGFVPLIGTWGVDSNQLVVSVSTFGFSYLINGDGTCDASNNVTAMTGTATDALFHANDVSITRTA